MFTTPGPKSVLDDMLACLALLLTVAAYLWMHGRLADNAKPMRAEHAKHATMQVRQPLALT